MSTSNSLWQQFRDCVTARHCASWYYRRAGDPGGSPGLSRSIAEHLDALHTWMVNILGDLSMSKIANTRIMDYYGDSDWFFHPGDELEWYEWPVFPEPDMEVVD